MYDDASYYAFIPSAQDEKPSTPAHKRKQSLLKQSDVSPGSVLFELLSDAPFRRTRKLTSVYQIVMERIQRLQC